MKTTLIIPTMNEIDGVKAIMPKIDRSWCDEVIIVDGGSKDGTVEWLQENKWNVFVQSQRGLGHAYREALSKTSGDVILTFSPDGNSLAEKIPELIAKMKEGYDMVIVSRYFGSSKSQDDDALTSIGNPIFTGTINFLFGGSYTDSLVIFRAYKRSILDRLNIDAVHMTYEAQISMRAAKAKLKIADIGGDEPKRIGGERKMNPFKVGSAIIWEMLRSLLWRQTI